MFCVFFCLFFSFVLDWSETKMNLYTVCPVLVLELLALLWEFLSDWKQNSTFYSESIYMLSVTSHSYGSFMKPLLWFLATPEQSAVFIYVFSEDIKLDWKMWTFYRSEYPFQGNCCLPLYHCTYWFKDLKSADFQKFKEPWNMQIVKTIGGFGSMFLE